MPPNIFKQDASKTEQEDIHEPPRVDELAVDVPWDGESDLEIEVTD